MTITPSTLVRKQLHAEFVVMTKILVDALLELNTRNRHLRPTVVETYRRAIESGIWCPTNQGIGVTASGVLADGQTRLHGLRASKYPPVVMLVALGLPDEAIAAIDCGVNRKPADYLHFLFDIRVSSQVSAILRTNMLARRNFNDALKVPPQEYAAEFERIGASIRAVLSLENIAKLPAAILAALVDAHHKGYESEVESFATALATGEMLQKDHPALTLRNWIAGYKGTGSAATADRWRKTTRALQAYIDNQPLAKLYRTKSPIVAAVERGREQRGAVPI